MFARSLKGNAYAKAGSCRRREMAAKSPAHVLLPKPTALCTCPRQKPGRGRRAGKREVQKRVGFGFSILGVGVGGSN